MNNEELLKGLKDANIICEQQNAPINVLFSLDKIISMLTPKKPIGTYTNYKCPVCGRRVRSGKGSSSFVRDKRCQDCGQMLNWEEE